MPDEQAEQLKEYEVEIAGLPHTILLSDEEAEARGLKGSDAKAKQPANKSRTGDKK